MPDTPAAGPGHSLAHRPAAGISGRIPARVAGHRGRLERRLGDSAAPPPPSPASCISHDRAAALHMFAVADAAAGAGATGDTAATGGAGGEAGAAGAPPMLPWPTRPGSGGNHGAPGADGAGRLGPAGGGTCPAAWAAS